MEVAVGTQTGQQDRRYRASGRLTLCNGCINIIVSQVLQYLGPKGSGVDTTVFLEGSLAIIDDCQAD